MQNTGHKTQEMLLESNFTLNNPGLYVNLFPLIFNKLTKVNIINIKAEKLQKQKLFIMYKHYRIQVINNINIIDKIKNWTKVKK